MQQFKTIRQKLQIHQFPVLQTREFGLIKAPQMIIGCFAFGLLFNLLFGWHAITYFLMGFGLPIICRYKDIKLFNYWECLALLLWVRMYVSDTFQMLDGLFLVLLWHPNFGFAQKFINWVKGYKENGTIDANVEKLKKML